MMALVAAQAAFLSAIMAIAWAFQKSRANAGWVDVFWTFATGLTGIMGAIWPSPGVAYWPRQCVVAVLIGVWALRLGMHLRQRVLTRPEDARYAGFRRDWGMNFERRLFWLLQVQAVAALPLAVAILLAARNPVQGIAWADIAALGIFGVALSGEAVADRQLARFIADPANKGRVCDQGLWTWSRHPNYFFEFLSWCVWPLFAFSSAWPLGWIAWMAPALMYWLLVHVSGIPPLERVMLATRGDSYRAYQRQTSRFLPLPPRHEALP